MMPFFTTMRRWLSVGTVFPLSKDKSASLDSITQYFGSLDISLDDIVSSRYCTL